MNPLCDPDPAAMPSRSACTGWPYGSCRDWEIGWRCGWPARVARGRAAGIGSATGVFHASATELEALGVASHVVRNIATGTVFEQAIKEADQARQQGASLITIRDETFPA